MTATFWFTSALWAMLLVPVGFVSSNKEKLAPSPSPKIVQVAGKNAAPPSKAEQITRLNDNIMNAQRAITKLKSQIEERTNEYSQAEADFQTLDKNLKAEKETIEQLATGGMLEEAKKREEGLKPLQEQWNLAHDRFELAIERRKVLDEAIHALNQRIEQEQKALDRLEGKEVGPPAPVTPSPNGNGTTSPPAVAPSPTPAETPPAMPTLPGLTNPLAPTPPTTTTPTPEQQPLPLDDPAIKKAQEIVEQRRQALAKAEQKLNSTTERVKVLKNAIRVANKFLESEKLSADQAEKTIATLTKQIAETPPGDAMERQALADRLASAERRLTEARDQISSISTKLESLNEELGHLNEEQQLAAREADKARADVEEATGNLANAMSPYSRRNIIRWFIEHGPNLIAILLGVFVLYLLVRQFSRNIVQLVASHTNRGSDEDRENRAQTLVGVFRYAATLAVLGGGLVMFLDEAGVPIVPLMGGAAVVGLAVAFGAQNLIRDYFTGFMILMEDQYGVNDVVRIGTTAGLVEKITLRVTALRDLEGVLHFIPHGSITSVSNLTHTWSRAQIDVPVPYDADLQQVISVLTDLGRELRRDSFYGLKITEDPEMLGVEAFAESAVIVRFLLKTRPLQQWTVKREMLKRIKLRFDEMGISIPFPQRTVHHRFQDGPPTSFASKIFENSNGYEVERIGS